MITSYICLFICACALIVFIITHDINDIMWQFNVPEDVAWTIYWNQHRERIEELLDKIKWRKK